MSNMLKNWSRWPLRLAYEPEGSQCRRHSGAHPSIFDRLTLKLEAVTGVIDSDRKPSYPGTPQKFCSVTSFEGPQTSIALNRGRAAQALRTRSKAHATEACRNQPVVFLEVHTSTRKRLDTKGWRTRAPSQRSQSDIFDLAAVTARFLLPKCRVYGFEPVRFDCRGRLPQPGNYGPVKRHPLPVVRRFAAHG